MKKLLCFILAAACLMTSFTALAETKTINPTENRKIKLSKVKANEVEEGISPTTGLTLSTLNVPEGFSGMALTGRYMPMVMQFGNENGHNQWGLSYADVLYETYLHKNGTTRMTAVFNDRLPDSAGYCRSARVGNAWLWYEWGGAYIFYGYQKTKNANVKTEINNMLKPKGVGILTSGLTYDGTNGKTKSHPWKDYFFARSGLKSPYNRDVSVSGMYENVVDPNYVPPNHAYKFTDETPDKGDTALSVKVVWNGTSPDQDERNGLQFVYDIDSNTYLRYHRGKEDVLTPHVDMDNGEQLSFSNVIVQYTKVQFPGTNVPVVYTIGKNGRNFAGIEGNADFFMCGKHIAGYWRRDSIEDRTVFYGPDGKEISLQRGKTMIVILPNNDADKNMHIESGVSYSDSLH